MCCTDTCGYRYRDSRERALHELLKAQSRLEQALADVETWTARAQNARTYSTGHALVADEVESEGEGSVRFVRFSVRHLPSGIVVTGRKLIPWLAKVDAFKAMRDRLVEEKIW